MLEFPTTPQLNETVSYQGFSYQWDGTKWVVPLPPDPPSVPVFVSIGAPQPPLQTGSLWFNINLSTLNVWAPRPTGYEWTQAISSADTVPFVIVSVDEPTGPIPGTLWYNPSNQDLKTWIIYEEPGTWMTLIQDSSLKTDPAVVIVSESSPPYPTPGLLWYKPSTFSLSIWLNIDSAPVWQPLSATTSTTGTTQGAQGVQGTHPTMLWGYASPIQSGNKVYFSISGPLSYKESDASVPLPFAGTLSNLYVKLSGYSRFRYTFEVMRNSIPTGVKVTTSVSEDYGQDLKNLAEFAAGDTFSIRSSPPDTPLASEYEVNVQWTARFDPT